MQWSVTNDQNLLHAYYVVWYWLSLQILMSVLKEQIAVLRTATTLLVDTLALAMLDFASMPMDMIVMVRTQYIINGTAL